MKIKLVILVSLVTGFLSAQNNLLDTSTWTAGSGSVTGFYRQGLDFENIRELDTDPYNSQSIIWKAIPDSNSEYVNGGWKIPDVITDHTKTFRFSVWVKKMSSMDGRLDFGIYAENASGGNTTLELDDNISSSGLCFMGDLPILNKWYLIVGFIHSSSYTGTTSIGGIYDPSTGQKVVNILDLKFSSSSYDFSPRIYNAWNTNTLAENHFFEPSLYEVNGQEPTISELLNPNTPTDPPSGGETVWNTNGLDINYNSGNVGIGTSSPDMKLTVKGSIHAEEVKVDLSVPAPDYVFKENYKLKSLQEVQNYIQENGHLPNIPSAKEMEANGVEVGKMEMKLLEKIEELTLYVIELKKEIELLKKD